MSNGIELTWEFEPAREAVYTTQTYSEQHVRDAAGSGSPKYAPAFVDECREWVAANPEKIDLDRLAPGTIFKDKNTLENAECLRILLANGTWVDETMTERPGFKRNFVMSGVRRYEPIVLVSTDSSVPTR